MKKYLILIVLFVGGINATLFAQQQDKQTKRNATERTDMVTQKMTEQLALNKEQQTQVHTLILKREKMRDAGTLAEYPREQIVADINKVLTPEQQKKWEQIRKEARAKHEQQKSDQTKEASKQQKGHTDQQAATDDIY